MARWGRIGSRGDVEDRRSIGGALGGVGLGGVALIVVFNLLLGTPPEDILGQLEDIPIQTQQNIDTSQFEGEDNYEVFASTVLGSTTDMWRNVFGRMGRDYEPPKLVLFRGSTESSCGGATSAVGPHYCPIDSTIYLDETFFDELVGRFGAQGGDVAEAYVIAHEVAHHAQHELGVLGSSGPSSNEESVKVELQADCFAGLWANSIEHLDVFEQGEIREAMDAAASVGDDRIQSTTTGRINPESWTHGSSEARVSAFNRGFEVGSLNACNF